MKCVLGAKEGNSYFIMNIKNSNQKSRKDARDCNKYLLSSIIKKFGFSLLFRKKMFFKKFIP